MTFNYEIYRTLRDRSGMTDYKVTQIAGINSGSLTSWKNGKSEPKYQTIEKVARVFGVSAQAFMESDRC